MERTLAYSQAYSGIEPGVAAAPFVHAVTDLADVVVHRGGDDNGPVAIHRGASSALAAAGGGPIWGIKVHYGASQGAGESRIGGALVSDEM